MNKENIKWVAIQPLTGGMYLGAEEAIGHEAEFILSFAGLMDGNINDKGEYDKAGNELYLWRYLEKHNRIPIRYEIQEGMFDTKLLENLNPTIFSDDSPIDMKYTLEQIGDIDLVVAVPVCSGLSIVTTAKQETKDARNCNMQFITAYTLKVIKPKVYVFENAPTLMSDRGKGLVEYFKKLAKETGYSVLFYKTNTMLHHNCQNRPRTFVVFFRHNSNNENEEPFVWDYENAQIEVSEYFKNMEASDFNNDVVETAKHNLYTLQYFKELYGDKWRKYANKWPMGELIKHNKLNDFKDWLKNKNFGDERTFKYIDHIINKTSQGLNYYGDDIVLTYKGTFPSVQFRSIPNVIHPYEDRVCTIREHLNLMGHPADFEWLTGNNKGHLPKIGQNVPVKTAKFIVEQCLKSIENWDNERGTEFNASYQDNTKQKKIW